MRYASIGLCIVVIGMKSILPTRCAASEVPVRVAATGVVLFKLDPKTEIASEDRNRTDTQFFHGIAIRQALKADNAELADRIRKLATAARSSDQKPIVRDGEYGVRVASGDAVLDVIVCFSCRPPRLRVGASRLAEERELILSDPQERFLRAVLQKAFGKQTASSALRTNDAGS